MLPLSIYNTSLSLKDMQQLLTSSSSQSFHHFYPSIYPSIACPAKQFQRQMLPIQLSFLISISRTIILSSLTLCNIFSFFVNNQLDSQFFFLVYLFQTSLHVSSSHVLIIRRVNCINTTSGICHSVQMTVQYAGLDGDPTSSIQACIPDGHPYRVTYTRRRIDRIDSPDDEHITARNMQRGLK